MAESDFPHSINPLLSAVIFLKIFQFSQRSTAKNFLMLFQFETDFVK
ncbi:hypothetical protein HMPREF0621_1556 [Pasteurella dagmatis ATCC 43325]|uniref:Uncharacterized protein n=1 Tax=Pasteurella dagmatis ATCC 43325 TaxID=667128 RepID=C9PRD2_9PAST|nr:hypothetical protein HMPREF0621_1556 [Pasteurella dagmatis ATCC 43325]